MKIPYLTVTGRQFDLWDIQPGELALWDLAHGCAKECRFGNQIEPHYSVAEHQVHVANVCIEFMGNPAAQTLARVHDAAEGLGLRDLPGPVKHWDGMIGYTVLEARVQRAIYSEFGFDVETGDFNYLMQFVKRADKLMYHVENLQLRGRKPPEDIDLPDIKLQYWSDTEARLQYIKAVAEPYLTTLGKDRLPPIFDARSRDLLGVA